MTAITTTDRPVTEYELWKIEQSWLASKYPTTGITFTDFFCGFGGSSIGLTEAGLELVWAANHWPLAIENHASNFRTADHFVGDISGYDMRRVPRADVAWISPECTWHSPAGGRKRVRAEMDALFPDDYVASEAGERSRATMWDVVRAAEAKAFKVVIVENVVEVTSWPLFDRWLESMETLGYNYQIVCVTAAHIGDELNPYAPQWRDRIYIVFYKKTIPFPVIEPRPIAWCEQCGRDVEARQSWKKKDQRHDIGKYGPQYVYVCASNNHPSFVVEPYVLPAISAIDTTDLGTRIGDRKKLPAAATLRRIGVGIRMFARPIVTAAAGQTYDAASPGQPRKFYRVIPADGAPLDPRMTTVGDALAVPPFVTNVRHGAHDHGRQYDPTSQPFQTAQTKIGDALAVPPFVTMLRKNGQPALLDEEPLATLATARHHAVTLPEGSFIQKHHGGLDYARPEHMVKSVDEPLAAVVAKPNLSLVIPYRRGKVTPAGDAPLPTMTTSQTTGLVTTEISDADLEEMILNSSLRMLGPREHGRAQRFPDSYRVTGSKGNQTKGFGNAVASNVAHWLGRHVVTALAGHVAKSERAS